MNTDDLNRLAARWEEHSDGLQLEITVDDHGTPERVEASDIVSDAATTLVEICVRTLDGERVFQTICPHGYVLDGVNGLIDTLLIPGRGRARAEAVWEIAFWARADSILTQWMRRQR
jgi:hypothetical protein